MAHTMDVHGIDSLEMKYTSKSWKPSFLQVNHGSHSLLCFVFWSLPCVIPMDILAVHWSNNVAENESIRKNEMLKIGGVPGGMYACMLVMEAVFI